VDKHDDKLLTRGVAGSLISMARRRAGLSRAELARRAGTSPAALVALESGARQPTLPTLYRILDAAGFDLRVHLEPADDHDETLRAWERARPQAEREQWDRERGGWIASRQEQAAP
jgi:transcriptional regulator with XRE-family HTH domain